MGTIIDLFPPNVKQGKSCKLSDPKATKEELLAYWKEKNDVISDEFHKFSVFDKQKTLDTVLEINWELYNLVLKLREQIK